MHRYGRRAWGGNFLESALIKLVAYFNVGGVLCQRLHSRFSGDLHFLSKLWQRWLRAPFRSKTKRLEPN